MASKRFRTLLAVALFCFSATARETWSLPRIGESLDCRAALLLSVRAHVPSLFETGAEYDVDMLDFLATNRTLTTYLATHPTFLEEAKLRQAPFDLSIRWEVQPPAADDAETDRAGFQAAHEGPVAALLAVATLAAGPSTLTAAMAEASSGLGSGRFAGALLGVALQLPPARRAAVLAAPSARHAIALLFEPGDLDWDQFRGTFRFAKHGWNPDDFKTLADVRDRLSTLADLEERLAAAALALPLYGNETTPLPLETPRRAWVDRFDETVAALPTLAEWNAPALAQLRHQLANLFGVRTRRRESTVRTLRAVEVPPLLAAFRGIPGGDCATKMCFAYSYLPRERTFFLEDEHGEALGYAMLSHIEYQRPGEDYAPVWYLHDVTGNRLSPRLLEVFVAAFTKAAQEQERALLIPPANRIEAMNNHRPLITAFQGMTAGGTLFPIYFPDSALRDNLRASGVDVDVRYDVTTANPDAILPALSTALLKSVSVSFVEPRIETVAPVEPPTPAVAVLLALDLLTGARLAHAKTTLKADVARIAAGGIATGKIDYGPRRAAATALLKSRAVDDNAFDALNAALQNPGKLPLQAYYDDVDARFRAFGIDAPETLRETRPYLFYEGHLAAPDRLSTEDAALRKLTVLYAVTLMRRWPHPALAYGAVAESPPTFFESERFRNAVRSWLGRDGEARDKLRALHKSSADFSFLDADERTALAEALDS